MYSHSTLPPVGARRLNTPCGAYRGAACAPTVAAPATYGCRHPHPGRRALLALRLHHGLRHLLSSRRGRGEVAARSRRDRGGEVAARSARITQGTHIMHLAGGRHGADPTYYSQDPWPLSHIVGSPHGAPLAELCPRPCLSIERGLAEECCVPEVVLSRAVVVFFISKRPPREERARAEMSFTPFAFPLPGRGDEYGCVSEIGACPYGLI